MDTMLVRTSELAEVTIEPGDSSRNPWDGGAGQGWKGQASTKQYLAFVSLSLTNVDMLGVPASMTRMS